MPAPISLHLTAHDKRFPDRVELRVFVECAGKRERVGTFSLSVPQYLSVLRPVLLHGGRGSGIEVTLDESAASNATRMRGQRERSRPAAGTP